MTVIPHFALPLRYHAGVAGINEQDSDADVAACVFAVCITEPGQFLDLPGFGLPDITFGQEPLAPSAILGPISRWEPRASALVTTSPSLLDEAIVNANVQIGATH